MNQFPEIFSGDVGLTAMQFASGMCDITAGANLSTVELFNPVQTDPTKLTILTLTGLGYWAAAAGNLKMLKSVSATDVATAADAGPFFMDFRPTVTAIGTLTKGAIAATGTELWRIPVPAAMGNMVFIPCNMDLQQGTGLNFQFDTATTRMVIIPIWVERVQTA